MRTSHRFATCALTLVVAASLVACNSSPSTATSGTPSLDFTNGPSSPGPFILRLENGSRAITNDPSNGLFAIHGIVSDLTVCTNDNTKVPVDRQFVNTPSTVQAVNELLKGQDNAVAIYDQGDISQLSPFDPVKFCTFIHTNAPAYTGQVMYQLHINGEGNLSLEWEGFVTRTSDGALLHYIEQQYARPRPDGSVEFIIESIRIQ